MRGLGGKKSGGRGAQTWGPARNPGGWGPTLAWGLVFLSGGAVFRRFGPPNGGAKPRSYSEANAYSLSGVTPDRTASVASTLGTYMRVSAGRDDAISAKVFAPFLSKVRWTRPAPAL